MDGQKLVLAYWGIRGLGQPLRFLLEYLGLPYEDKKYTDQAEWFGKDKPAMATNPLVNLPYLKDGDHTVFESRGIQVYSILKANRKELLGTTDDELLLIAQTIGVTQDVSQAFFKEVLFVEKEKFGTDGKQQFTQKVVPLLTKLNAFLNGRKFSAGDNLTFADFNLFEIVDAVRLFDQGTFDSLANVKTFWTNFTEIPQIKAYRASDRYQERPFMPPNYANWG